MIVTTPTYKKARSIEPGDAIIFICDPPKIWFVYDSDHNGVVNGQSMDKHVKFKTISAQ